MCQDSVNRWGDSLKYIQSTFGYSNNKKIHVVTNICVAFNKLKVIYYENILRQKLKNTLASRSVFSNLDFPLDQAIFLNCYIHICISVNQTFDISLVLNNLAR